MWNTFTGEKNPLIFLLDKQKGCRWLLFLHGSIVVCNFARGGKFDGMLSESFWKGGHKAGESRAPQWWAVTEKSMITTPWPTWRLSYLPCLEADSWPMRWKWRSYRFTLQCLLSSATMKNTNGPLHPIIFSIEKENILRFGLGAASDYRRHSS